MSVMRRLASAAALSLLAAGPLSAQQTCTQAAEPYVFFLFDTSNPMNYRGQCTELDLSNGACQVLCPQGNCFVPLQGDDPDSKLYQLKAALHGFLSNYEGGLFGFASFNQDALRAGSKHWLYEAGGPGVQIPGFGAFPAAGVREVFGRRWPCDTGDGDHEAGCSAATPADLDDAWELERMRRLPRGFQKDTLFFVRQSGLVYRLRYHHTTGTRGEVIETQITLERCSNASCSNRLLIAQSTVSWSPVGEFLSWDDGPVTGPNRTDPRLGYFGASSAADATATNTCSGWEPNDDDAADPWNAYSLRWPTDASDPRGPFFSLGDVIPLDWLDDRKDEILLRLAPNQALDPTAAPDFRTASYLRNRRASGEDFLRLKKAARPLIATGETPHGNALRAFRTWYAGCATGVCPPGSGWASVAAAQDPEWACRNKHLVILTGGDDTCGGADPCTMAFTLLARDGIKTHVIAVGQSGPPSPVPPGYKLNCMAANGGTMEPRYLANPADLGFVLSEILTVLSGPIEE